MRRALEPAPERDARVVAEHVHAAEGLPRPLGQGLHLAEIADVGANGERLDAEPARLARHAVHRGLVDVGQHHPRALARERQHQRAADPTAPARDDRNLVLELIHGDPR